MDATAEMDQHCNMESLWCFTMWVRDKRFSRESFKEKRSWAHAKFVTLLCSTYAVVRTRLRIWVLCQATSWVRDIIALEEAPVGTPVVATGPVQVRLTLLLR